MAELYTKIREYRSIYGMSQTELAEIVNVRRETISRLEKGEYNPSLRLAMDIARVFGAAVEDVFWYQ